jgi:hypothetical protein
VRRIRIASADLGYNLHDWTWGVPGFPVSGLPVPEEVKHGDSRTTARADTLSDTA